MDEIARLGIAVDSTQVKGASVSLDDLARAGQRAETSTTLLSKATGILSGVYGTLVKTVAAYKIADLIRDSAMLAARYETMGITMKVAGNNAGYTMAEMEKLTVSLQKSGISMMESRNVLTQLATANIDLANASKLGRAAQDLAVVAGINSSDALGRMTHAIKSNSVEILRTMGLNVSFENSYKKLAGQLGINVTLLTEAQRTQARANATLEGAAAFVGIYEESMTTAGKAMTSLTRYWEDFRLQAGKLFLPMLASSVFGLTDVLKQLNKEVVAAGPGIEALGSVLGSSFSLVASAVVPALKVTAAYFALFTAVPAIYAAVAGAVMGVVNGLALYAFNVITGTAATIGFNTVLFGTSVNAALAAGSLTMLRLAGNLLFAAFAGWEIGTWLRNQFVEARVAGLAFISVMLKGWENLKYYVELAGAAMKSLLPWSESYANASARITAAHTAQIAAIDDNIGGLVEYELAADKASKAGTVRAGKTEQERIAIGRSARDAADAEAARLKKLKESEEAGKKSADAYKQQVSATRDYIKSLKEQIENVGLADEQLKMLDAARKAALAPTMALRVEIMTLASELSRAARADKEASEAAKERAQTMEDGFQALVKNREAYREARVEAQAYIDTISRQAADTVRGVGKGSQYREDNTGLNQIEDRLMETRNKLLNDKRTFGWDEQTWQDQLALAEAVYTKEVEIYKRTREELLAAQADWKNGATEAIANYLTDIEDVAGATERMFTNAFKGMEDALVEFVTTGKMDFKSLADSIISDIIRITIQQSIMKPLLQAFGLSFMANGGAYEGGVQKFSSGGTFTNKIVNEPTLFKFASGTGMMGEAGPEAIMPLTRGPDGQLGVKAQTSNAPQTVQHISIKIDQTVGDIVTLDMLRKNNASLSSQISSRIARANTYGADT